jgi:predicted nucleic acid-binding protein
MTDFLICAVAVRKKLQIFTTDVDFQHYRKHLPITLYALEKN